MSAALPSARPLPAGAHRPSTETLQWFHSLGVLDLWGESEIVAGLVGEDLQEAGTQPRIVADDASGSERPLLVTVMV